MGRFDIGDKVFRGQYAITEEWETCPDCFGKLKLTVKIGDDSIVEIPCARCSLGYDPPRGVVKTYRNKTVVKPHIVTGLTISGDKTEYQLDGSYGESGSSWVNSPEEATFATEVDAMEYAESERIEHEKTENRRLHAKTQDHHSWAWHVTYHRRELKRSEQEAERHRVQIGIAQSKAKGGSNAKKV